MTKKVEKKKPAAITKAKPLRSKKPPNPTSQDQEKNRILVEALRHSEEKYRTLFEDSRDAITITDRDGTFLDVNKAMLDLFGYRKEQIMRMKFQDLYVDPADAARFQHEIEKKGSLRDYEAKLFKKGSKVMHCLFIVTQRRSEGGTIAGYQGIVRDITAQKVMEEALRESEKKYQDAVIAAERLRKRFADEIFFPVPLEPVHVTVSVGVANYLDGEEISSFVKRADQNMYEAKSKGKNCVYFSD